MSILQAVLLGLVQGLGEFLPISSSGHLLLARMVMGLTIDETPAYHMLDILLHVGTLIPVIIVFWKDWWAILRNPFRSKTLLLLFIASLPTLLFKVVFDDFISSCDTGWFLGISFLMTGFMLVLAEAISAHHRKTVDQPNYKHAIVMGFMQGIALLPGVSRSGSTLAGGLAAGLNRKSAAKFSFMMSAPAIVGALIIDGKNAIEEGWIHDLDLVPTLVGILVAAVCGYVAICFMLSLISRVSLNWFALYVSLLGLLILVLQFINYPGVTPLVVPQVNEALDAVGTALRFWKHC